MRTVYFIAVPPSWVWRARHHAVLAPMTCDQGAFRQGSHRCLRRPPRSSLVLATSLSGTIGSRLADRKPVGLARAPGQTPDREETERKKDHKSGTDQGKC